MGHATCSIAATAGPTCKRGRHVYPASQPSSTCFSGTAEYLMCTVSDTSWPDGRDDSAAAGASRRSGGRAIPAPGGFCQPAIDMRLSADVTGAPGGRKRPDEKRLPELKQTSSLRASTDASHLCGIVRRAHVGDAGSGQDGRGPIPWSSSYLGPIASNIVKPGLFADGRDGTTPRQGAL